MTSEEPTDLTSTPPTFDVLPLSRELRQAIDELGYTHPTPVQREVFEPASRGRDVVVQARTGTGKTAAFGMPVVDSLVQRSLSAVQVLILCPTRELALQVHRELDTLGRHRGIRSVAVYGGAPMGRQIEELAAGAQVLAGTPGRVLDHLRRGSLDPRSIRVFILDESDEMLSMGFLPQINEILGHLPTPHQTLLFSATLPPDIERLAETRLKEPLFLTLSGDQIGALDIEHLVYLTGGDKLKAFTQVIEVENPESAIVFCNTRDETKRVAAALDRLGYAADWINADLAQNERESVMAATRRGDLRFLVCTDVAARGIDISHLTHVINFDLPESPESYVHRTGRTGRAGRTGTAISLIEPSDIGNLYMLRLVYKIFPIEKQLPSAGELRTRQELDVVEMFAQAFEDRPIHKDDILLARRLITHDAGERIIAGLLRDHLGARPEAVREATEARRAKTRAAAPSEGATEAAAARPGKNILPSEAGPIPPPVRSGQTPGVASSERRPGDEQARDRRRDGRTDVRRTTREPDRTDRPERRNHDSRASSENRTDDAKQERSQENRQDRKREPVNRNNGSSNVREASRTYRDEDFEFGYSVSEIPNASASSPSADVGNDASLPASVDSPADPQADDTQELFVNVGRSDGAEPEDFLRALEQGGVTRSDGIRISVRRTHSFVRVRAQDCGLAEAALNGATIAGKVAAAEPSRASAARQ